MVTRSASRPPTHPAQQPALMISGRSVLAPVTALQAGDVQDEFEYDGSLASPAQATNCPENRHRDLQTIPQKHRIIAVVGSG